MFKFQTLGQLQQKTISQLRSLRTLVLSEQQNYPANSIEFLYLMGLEQNIDRAIMDKLNYPLPLTLTEKKHMFS